MTGVLLTADPDRTPTEMADTLVDGHRRLEVLQYNGNLAVRPPSTCPTATSAPSTHEVGSHHDEARALTNLGVTYRTWGRLREAVECLERAARRLGELDNLRDQATALEELGSTWRAIGDHERARRAWGEALAVLERLPGEGPRIAAARVRLVSASA